MQSPAFIYKLCHLIWECGTITIGYFKVNLGVHVVYMTGAWTDIRILHNAPDFPKYSRTWKSTITVQNRYALMLLTTPNRSSVVTGQGKGLFLFFFCWKNGFGWYGSFEKKGIIITQYYSSYTVRLNLTSMFMPKMKTLARILNSYLKGQLTSCLKMQKTTETHSCKAMY